MTEEEKYEEEKFSFRPLTGKLGLIGAIYYDN